MAWPFSRRRARYSLPDPPPLVRVLHDDNDLAEAVARAAEFERRINSTVGARLARYEALGRARAEALAHAGGTSLAEQAASDRSAAEPDGGAGAEQAATV